MSLIAGRACLCAWTSSKRSGADQVLPRNLTEICEGGMLTDAKTHKRICIGRSKQIQAGIVTELALVCRI